MPGRPILYRTTPDFLRVFGLSSLDELPEVELTDLRSRQQLQLDVSEAPAAQEGEAAE